MEWYTVFMKDETETVFGYAIQAESIEEANKMAKDMASIGKTTIVRVVKSNSQ